MSTTLSPQASRDVASQLHPYTNARKLESEGPLIITRGEGVYVYDETGQRYIEGMAGLWCTALGFSERRLIDAATRQLETLPYYHVFSQKSSLPTIELADKLIDMAPGPMSKVIFANSGSEANDTAIKLVRYYNNARGKPQKKKIISRMKAYHGVTVAAASLTGLPNNHRDFDLPLPGVLHTSCPHYWRYGETDESEEAFASRMAADLEALIEREGADTIAAFIGEPVMGAGGVIVPPKTYWDKIQAVLKKHDILLIADEVICGFGRTGEMFGCDTFHIRPDLMTVAKALSSAYLPISAVMLSDGVYQTIADNSATIGTFGHGYTYGGHPVSAAVALETLKIYEERGIVGHVQQLAPRLQSGLRELAEHPLVGEARGVGLVGALELVADKTAKTAFPETGKMGAFVAQRLQAHGVILRPIADSVAVSPPLVIDETQIDDILSAWRKALDEGHAWARQQGWVA